MKIKLLFICIVAAFTVSCGEDEVASQPIPSTISVKQGDVREYLILIETDRRELQDSAWQKRGKTTIAGFVQVSIAAVNDAGAQGIISMRDVSVTDEQGSTEATIDLSGKSAAVFFPANGTPGTILQTDSVSQTDYRYFIQAVRTLKDMNISLPETSVEVGGTWSLAKRDTANALGAKRESVYGFEYTYAENKDTLKHRAAVVPFTLATVVDRVLERAENVPAIDIEYNNIKHSGEMIIDVQSGRTLSMSSDLDMTTAIKQQTETGANTLIESRIVNAVRVVLVSYMDGLDNTTTEIQQDTNAEE